MINSIPQIYLYSDSCEAGQDFTITFFESFGYLQTIAFTIGYGHITPVCHDGKVSSWKLNRSRNWNMNFLTPYQIDN